MNKPTTSLLFTLLTSCLLPAFARANPTVNNPGFEGSPSGWVSSSSGVAYDTADAHSGAGCVQLTGSASHPSIFQTVSGLQPNTLYKLSAFAKLGTSSSSWVGVENYGGAEVYDVVSGTNYQEYDVTFQTGSSNTSVTIFFGNGGVGTSFADDYSLTQVLVPASDTQNTGNWKLNPTLSDEFNSTSLDTTKWEPTNRKQWNGRAPSWFDQGNVSVSGGYLHLLMVNENLIPNGNFETGDLSSWTSTGSATITNKVFSDYHYAVMLDTSASLQQLVSNLQPNTKYTLSGKLLIGTGSAVTLSASGYGGSTASVTLHSTDAIAKNAGGQYQYALQDFTFTTGPSANSVIITVANSGAAGTTYCDEIALVPYTLATGTHIGTGYYLSASYVESKSPPPFGYYEARLKAADASNTSAFWFWYAGTSNSSDAGEEIDVCELVGNPSYDSSYQYLLPMNTHYFPHTPPNNGNGADYNNSYRPQPSGFKASDFHVYGVDWEADTITYYLDGTQVYQINQLQPPAVPTANGKSQVQHLTWLTFDTEIFSYHGIPNGTSDFQVDYVRAWTK